MPIDASEECASSLYSIVLAAGASTRYGSPKQLALVRGRSMLCATIDSATRVTNDRVILVLGAHATVLTASLADFRGTIVINAGWSEGIASSIRLGIRHLPATSSAAMLLLADQPFVTAEELNALISAWRAQPQSIAAAVYEDVIGVPAIFPSRFFGELANLKGDVGARYLLQRERNRLLRVPMPNAAKDVDGPEDLTDSNA